MNESKFLLFVSLGNSTKSILQIDGGNIQYDLLINDNFGKESLKMVG